VRPAVVLEEPWEELAVEELQVAEVEELLLDGAVEALVRCVVLRGLHPGVVLRNAELLAPDAKTAL
jgi:hypothetical protein